MNDANEPHRSPGKAHLAGLVLAGLTAFAAVVVWVRMPDWIGRLGYGDLLVLARLSGLAAVFALAAALEGMLKRAAWIQA